VDIHSLTYTFAVPVRWFTSNSSELFFFLQGKAPKEIHAILTQALDKHAPLYATVKNWVALFTRGSFSTCDAPRLGRHRTVTTPEIISQIQVLIFKDHRISVKQIADQLGISLLRVGYIIHENLVMRKLSAMWVPKSLNVKGASSVRNFGVFSAIRDRNALLPLLATMGETWLYHHDPEIKQQTTEWRHRVSPRPAPPPPKKKKNSE
jgi:histone-lysine N-methyltransferase SETMAR